jgi:hypothetical protein
MIRFIAVIFALVVATSVQAMPVAPYFIIRTA